MSAAPSRFLLAPLVEPDIPLVLLLYRQAILPVWIEYGRDHHFGRIEANIRRRMGGDDYWMTVARHGDTLAGYLAWERHPDHTSTHVVAHLRMILVHPDHQGTGLGQRLMRGFEAAARAAGCTKVLFDVVVGSPARRVYERQGYHHRTDNKEKVLD